MDPDFVKMIAIVGGIFGLASFVAQMGLFDIASHLRRQTDLMKLQTELLAVIADKQPKQEGQK
jgi:hypothetical protein